MHNNVFLLYVLLALSAVKCRCYSLMCVDSLECSKGPKKKQIVCEFVRGLCQGQRSKVTILSTSNIRVQESFSTTISENYDKSSIVFRWYSWILQSNIRRGPIGPQVHYWKSAHKSQSSVLGGYLWELKCYTLEVPLDAQVPY